MCVLRLFERNTSAFPDALAVGCEGRQLSYRQLDSIAERISAGLRAAGAKQGCLVGLLLDRSPELIAALLGVWKAGAAYVPIDSVTPAERVSFILEDAGAPFLITRRNLFPPAPHGNVLDPPVNVLFLDELCQTELPASSGNTEVDPGSLAYVIYTSGSTGKPKGTSITHGGLVNTIEGVAGDLQITPVDVVQAWSTIAFDVACLEIFLPLAFGASLYLSSHEGDSRLEQLLRSRATIVFGTPTMFRLLLEEGCTGDFKVQFVVGGEVLPLQLATTLARTCRALWNEYGPSETAVCATRTKINRNPTRITIGHPLPNVHVHLLDENFQPVPPGSIGEIYIGGAGVGLGYLNREELTRTSFLPDPFCPGKENRLFKSGDLAIELPDGSLDFIGRMDDQVKIRGYRIELGEIEAALSECNGVDAVVVRAVEWEDGDRRLVAFVKGKASFIPRWKESLQHRLPPYMMPAEFVTLGSFPTTAGGKTDVQALLAMRVSAVGPVEPPEEKAIDAAEMRLLAIWKRLLKLNSIELDDDFFALGGHSLLAARMLRQVQQAFGVRLAHSALVENPTIRGLAAYLRGSHAEHWPALATLRAGSPLLPPLFIAHGVGGSLLSFIELTSELGDEQPVYGLQLPPSVEEGHAQVTELAANYLRQVRAVQPYGPYHLAGHSSGGLMVFEMACQLVEQGECVALLALLDCDPNTTKPFQSQDGESSWRASLRRAFKEFRSPENGIRDLVQRRYGYQKMKIKNGLAKRLRPGKIRGWLLGAEGILALAMKGYQLKPYSGTATLFVARDEPGHEYDLSVGWTEKVLGGCEVHPVPGTHRTILMRPHVSVLATEIRQRIARSVSALA